MIRAWKTFAQSRALLAALAATALLLASGAAASPSAAPSVRFSFEGYVNNVRLLPPLADERRLGVVWIRGSGVLPAGSVNGTLVHSDDPKLPRYKSRWLRAEIIGGSWQIAAHGVSKTLVLTVRITASSHPGEECAPGLTGTLTLVDTTAKLANGERGDTISLAKWAGSCKTHVHDWSNRDSRQTGPTSGGPGGGNWATVRVTASR